MGLEQSRPGRLSKHFVYGESIGSDGDVKNGSLVLSVLP